MQTFQANFILITWFKFYKNASTQLKCAQHSTPEKSAQFIRFSTFFNCQKKLRFTMIRTDRHQKMALFTSTPKGAILRRTFSALPLLFTFCLLLGAPRSVASTSKVTEQGDILLGGLFPIHNKGKFFILRFKTFSLCLIRV